MVSVRYIHLKYWEARTTLKKSKGSSSKIMILLAASTKNVHCILMTLIDASQLI